MNLCATVHVYAQLGIYIYTHTYISFYVWHVVKVFGSLRLSVSLCLSEEAKGGRRMKERVGGKWKREREKGKGEEREKGGKGEGER